MKPGVDYALRTLAATLLTDVAPNVTVDYGRASAEFIAALMIVAAEDYDRAADVRVEENRAMREIFRDAAAIVPETALKAKLEAAALGEEASLRVSALDQTNDALKRILIELHEYVDGRPEPWADRIDRMIWRELRASATRRAIGFFPL